MKMKRMIISCMLSILMLCSITGQAFAMQGGNTNPTGVVTKILKDNENIRIAESSDSDTKTVAKFYKKKNIMEIEVTNLKDETTNLKVIDLNSVASSNKNMYSMAASASDLSSGGDQFMGYRYYLRTETATKTEWSLRNSHYHYIYVVEEDSAKAKELVGDFKDGVDQLNKGQVSLIAVLGIEAVAAIITLICIPEPVTTAAGVIAALGVAITNIPACWNMYYGSKKARESFARLENLGY